MLNSSHCFWLLYAFVFLLGRFLHSTWQNQYVASKAGVYLLFRHCLEHAIEWALTWHGWSISQPKTWLVLSWIGVTAKKQPCFVSYGILRGPSKRMTLRCPCIALGAVSSYLRHSSCLLCILPALSYMSSAGHRLWTVWSLSLWFKKLFSQCMTFPVQSNGQFGCLQIACCTPVCHATFSHFFPNLLQLLVLLWSIASFPQRRGAALHSQSSDFRLALMRWLLQVPCKTATCTAELHLISYESILEVSGVMFMVESCSISRCNMSPVSSQWTVHIHKIFPQTYMLKFKTWIEKALVWGCLGENGLQEIYWTFNQPPVPWTKFFFHHLFMSSEFIWHWHPSRFDDQQVTIKSCVCSVVNDLNSVLVFNNGKSHQSNWHQKDIQSMVLSPVAAAASQGIHWLFLLIAICHVSGSMLK